MKAEEFSQYMVCFKEECLIFFQHSVLLLGLFEAVFGSYSFILLKIVREIG